MCLRNVLLSNSTIRSWELPFEFQAASCLSRRIDGSRSGMVRYSLAPAAWSVGWANVPTRVDGRIVAANPATSSLRCLFPGNPKDVFLRPLTIWRERHHDRI